MIKTENYIYWSILIDRSTKLETHEKKRNIQNWWRVYNVSYPHYKGNLHKLLWLTTKRYGDSFTYIISFFKDFPEFLLSNPTSNYVIPSKSFVFFDHNQTTAHVQPLPLWVNLQQRDISKILNCTKIWRKRLLSAKNSSLSGPLAESFLLIVRNIIR